MSDPSLNASTRPDISGLFTPFRLKSILLHNRFVVPAMQRGASEEGRPPAVLADYYRQRIEGGFSLIIAESCAINHPSASHKQSVLRINRSTMRSWRLCVDGVRKAGGHMFIQLWHEGAMRAEVSEGPYAGAETLSPSGLLTAQKACGRSLTPADLMTLKRSYVESALMAQEVGASGVEIHAGHGYLLDQFLWSVTNRRTDGYGGQNIEDRVRFPAEVVTAIRKATGADFLISFRFSQWKVSYEGLTPIIDNAAQIVGSPAELDVMLGALRRAGVDLFHASTRRFDAPEWPPSIRGLAGWTRTLAGAPVITVGSVGGNNDVTEGRSGETDLRTKDLTANIARLVMCFAREEFDLVAVGRASIGDPEWANKVAAGYYDKIRPFSRDQLLEIRNQIT